MLSKEPKGEKRTLATHLQMTKKERERKQKQQHLKDGLSGGDSWEASHPFITPTRRIGSGRKPDRREPGSREGHCSGKHDQQEAFSMLHQSPIPSPGEGRDDTSLTAHSEKGKKRKRSRGKKKEKRNTPQPSNSIHHGLRLQNIRYDGKSETDAPHSPNKSDQIL
ncbi:hypothetical protein CDL15_Pgr026654 [Punica granatum]|uniref:Uncharacterized protein n=1 Tax=Punica granatum TaxID=22663 RepID=A0A218WL86_PUNGR|nr:hypothetical protein CDL15_Pgr026654 [Punica granatum]